MSRTKVLKFPPVQQLPDTGEYASLVSKVIEVKNGLVEDTAYRSVPQESDAFSSIPGYPLESKSIRVGRWYLSVMVTATDIYIIVPTANLSIRTAYTFPNRVSSPSVVFYDDVAYIGSEENDLVKIELHVVRERADLRDLNWNPQTVPTAPRMRSLTVSGPHLVAAYTRKSDESAFIPHRIMWSAANDPTSWSALTESSTTVGTNAGNYYFREISEIVNITSSNNDLLVFGRNFIVYGQIQAGVFRFRWTHLANIGLVAKYCFAKEQRNGYFLSIDGFYALSGGRELQSIGLNIINETVLDRINWAAIEQADCSVNRDMSAIIWSLPVDGSPINNLVVAYNYQTGNFSLLDLKIAKSVRYGAPDLVLTKSAQTPAHVRTFEEAGFNSIEELPFPPTSPVWSGDASEFGFVSSEPVDGRYQLKSLNGSSKLITEVLYSIVELDAGRKSSMESLQVAVEGTNYQDADDPTYIRFDISHGDDLRLLNRVPTLEADEGGFVRVARTNSRYHQVKMTANRYDKIKLLTMTYQSRASDKGAPISTQGTT